MSEREKINLAELRESIAHLPAHEYCSIPGKELRALVEAVEAAHRRHYAIGPNPKAALDAALSVFSFEDSK